MSAKPSRDFHLGQPGFLTRILEAFSKQLVVPNVFPIFQDFPQLEALVLVHYA
jgi:hypothetical protein